MGQSATESKRSHDFWATLHGERGEEWRLITGTNEFPIQSPIPVLGDLPGKGETRCYLLALDQVEPEILRRIVAHLAKKFGMTPEETEREMKTVGIPIPADDCSMMVLHPQKWF